MAEPRYFPFDGVEENGVYDRAYLSADFADYFKKFISNGVYNGFKNSLQVFSLNENMVLTIKSGAACIEGRGYEQDEDVTIQLEAANANFARYDLIVCQLDYLNRLIKVAAKTGAPTSSPVKPVVQRDSDIYEIALAEVYVPSGATKITQANITDKRSDISVCGWVHGVIDQVDTSDLYAQYEDYWNMVKAQIDSDMSQFASGFNLYGVASGSGTYTATVSGFVLMEGINVKIKFPNGSTGQATLNINGLGAKNIVRADGSAYPIKAGTIQNLVYDGTNFTLLNEGGWGTATAASVLPGETFTNDDGFQTGAMPSNGDASTSIVNGVLKQGYTDGGSIANLIPKNIVENINIAGIIGTSKRGAFGVATSKSIYSKTKIASYYGTTSYMDSCKAIEINNLGWIPKYIFAISFSKQSEMPLTQSETSLYTNIAFHIDTGIFKDTSTGTLFQQAYYAASDSDAGELPVYMSIGNIYVSRIDAYQTELYPESSYPGIPFSANRACLIVGGSSYDSRSYIWFAVG